MCDSGRKLRQMSSPGERNRARGRHDVRVDVVVRQHHALRVAGRARRVDERREIVRLHGQRARSRYAARRVVVVDGCALRLQLRQRHVGAGCGVALNAMTCLQRGHSARIAAIFAACSAFDDEDRRPRPNRGGCRRSDRGKIRIERNVGERRGEAGVVGDRPLRAVLRKDRDAIAGRTPSSSSPSAARRTRSASVACEIGL